MWETIKLKFRHTGLYWLWIAPLVVVLDFASKKWVTSYLGLGDSVNVLPVFSLTLAYNKGAAFSMLHTASGWQNIFFGSLAVIVSLGIIAWLSQVRSRQVWINIALCLIMGGAIGNALDRLQYGYVIDFAHFYWGDWHFAIFNFADACICVGAAILIANWMLRRED